MRVGIIGLQAECNTFFSTPTTLESFRRYHLHRGEAVRGAFAASHHEVAGFFQGLKSENIEAVPLFMAAALPSGRVTADALETMLGMMFEELGRAGHLDGLLVAPHGAAVSQAHGDMDGYWLTLLREKVGPAMPIICTLDPHANLSKKMIDACDATILYRTNPHVDQEKVGLEAAKLMARTLRGEVKPTQAAAFPPVAINIERQHTPSPPCKPMYELADRMLQVPGVLSNSIALGFPYADVEEMGSAFVVVTDNDPQLARKLVDELASYLVEHRAEFKGQLISVDEAVAVAATTPGPVCLLDMGDNVGGGGPGDSTIIAHAILKRGGDPKTFLCLFDPEAQEAARRAGAGKRITLKMGGKTDDLHGSPIIAPVVVRGLYDGKFTESQVRHGGWANTDMGLSAVVETDQGMTVLLTAARTMPSSLGMLTSCGLDPGAFQILIAKGVQAPAAAYGPVSKKLIRVNTPGVTSADMNHFKYERRRRPLYPFEEVGER